MLDDVIKVPRTDAVYNMHGYLTKVPVRAIVPFIEEHCPAGGTVADIFAGSGMTAIAARMSNRNAIVSDISALGQHICKGYLTEVNGDEFSRIAHDIADRSLEDVGTLYKTVRASDNAEVTLIRTIWSYTYQCATCKGEINYYYAFKTAKWDSKKMVCPHCSAAFSKKNATWIGEEPVLVVVKGENGKQVEQPINKTDQRNISQAQRSNILDIIPNSAITPNREMYRRSALKKWNLTETRLFFSPRNATTLFDLWSRINAVQDERIKKKLLFAFTAILPRASKRYQWSHKAPLNAANQNYYIAPVFFEWNIYELFLRKVSAVLKSDAMIFEKNTSGSNQEYITCSAHNLEHIADNSIDYVFTDPPFGSNIYYADMNLFQEAWINTQTNDENEAVIRTAGGKQNKESQSDRYYQLLSNAFREAYRILKPNGKCSIVFGNSKGEVWSIAQKAIKDAGFTGAPDSIKILDKGQRSVKGLNSGTEKVCTLDLIVTVTKRATDTNIELSSMNESELIRTSIDAMSLSEELSVSHIYVEVLRKGIARNLNIADIDMHDVLVELESRGIKVNPENGKLMWQKKEAA